jgi:hypothetical protein
VIVSIQKRCNFKRTEIEIKGAGVKQMNRLGRILPSKLLSLALLGAVTASSVAASGVGMSNTWIDLHSGKARCIQQATLAIKKAGFTENFEVAGETVYGDQEDYSALLRCVPDKNMAYIVVAGPDSNLADQYVSQVRKNYGGKAKDGK